MRPYLTILRDSFHEALVSRVLWMLLIVITIVLAFMAPLGVTGRDGPTVEPKEIRTPPTLAKQIFDQSRAGRGTPGSLIYQRLSSGARKQMDELASTPAGGTMKRYPGAAPEPDDVWLAGELNSQMQRPDFYEPAAWKHVQLGREARKLLKEGPENLAPDELLRFNRLALESAYPGELFPLDNRKESLVYFGRKLESMTLTSRDLQTVVGQFVFYILKFGVGVGGVLAGLLVTSSIMPQTFEAGAVDLLFSKPVRRSWVYVTKYLGGCAFVLILAAYFVGGVWFLAGWRFGVWNLSVLGSVPVFVFVFAVYYSVSCLAGAYWRNAIIAVIMSVVLWAIGWAFIFINLFGDSFFLRPYRIIKPVAAGSDLLAVTESSTFRRWNSQAKSWNEIFAPDLTNQVPFGPAAQVPYSGPIYDAQKQRIVALQPAFITAGLPPQWAHVWAGAAAENFVRHAAVAPPDDARILLREPAGRWLFVADSGIVPWDGENAPEKPKEGGIDLSRFLGGSDKDVGPDAPLISGYRAAIDAKGGELALLDEQTLYLCKLGENGKYDVRAQREVDDARGALLAIAGDTVLAAMTDGRVLSFKISDLSAREPLRLSAADGPNTLLASPKGRWFAILMGNQRLWLYDAVEHELITAPVSGQGKIVGIGFDAEGQLLVADRTDRVTVYRLPDGERVARYQPSRPWQRLVFEYVAYPLYRVIPKPQELDELNGRLIKNLDLAGAMISRTAGVNAPAPTRVWSPVWENGLFILVMLALGCWHVSRRDY